MGKHINQKFNVKSAQQYLKDRNKRIAHITAANAEASIRIKAGQQLQPIAASQEALDRVEQIKAELSNPNSDLVLKAQLDMAKERIETLQDMIEDLENMKSDMGGLLSAERQAKLIAFEQRLKEAKLLKDDIQNKMKEKS